MRIVIFDKPKKTIINILFILGIISFSISTLAVITVVLWKYYPQTVNKFDKMVPDFYGDKIKKLYKQAKQFKDQKTKAKHFLKLYSELENISTLNKYYSFRQESANFLIDYYMDLGKLKDAIVIAEKWEQDYPYDFRGKFKYIDIFSVVDVNKSSTYFQRLFEKHSDILDVRKRYLTYLLNQKEYGKALVMVEGYMTKDPYDFEAGFEYIEILKYLNPGKIAMFYKKFYKKHSNVEEVKNSYINYLVENKEYQIASVVSLEWIQSHQGDYRSELQYIEILKILNHSKVAEYYEKTYLKYENIAEVVNSYSIYLIANNQTNKALIIAHKYNQYISKKVSFQLFYMDNQDTFSQKQSKRYIINDFQVEGNIYTLKFNKFFENLNALRLDIDGLGKGINISNITVQVLANRKSEMLKISSINHLNTHGKDRYRISGDDPYIIFSDFQVFKNYKGNVNIKISLQVADNIEIDNKVRPDINQILQNKEWQLFIDRGNGFNEEESLHFSLLKERESFVSNVNINYMKVSNIRLDFPSLLEVKIDDFEIIINDTLTYKKKDILCMQNIKVVNKVLIVTGVDPSVTIKLKHKLDIKNIKIKIFFSGEEE